MNRSSRPTAELVLEERGEAGRVARLTVSYERRLNVLNTPLLEDLLARLADLSGTEGLRAVVLTGAGERSFIGGADIYEMSQLGPHEAEPFISRIHRVCDALRQLPVPVVARICGHCLGAGLEVALSCDLRVASTASTFGMPEVQVGVPSVIEAALLPRFVGIGRARELVLTGRVVAAEQAGRWGLVERVVPAAGVDAVVEEWLGEILSAAPEAVRRQKELCRLWEELPLATAVEVGIASFRDSWTSEEPRRYMQAFLDRRRRS